MKKRRKKRISSFNGYLSHSSSRVEFELGLGLRLTKIRNKSRKMKNKKRKMLTVDHYKVQWGDLWPCREKIPQSGICPAPCAFQQCASPLCFWGCPHCRLPSKIVFHQRVSSIKGCLALKVVFHQRLSSIKGRLPSKVIFHWRASSIKGRLPSKVVIHQGSSYIEGSLP